MDKYTVFATVVLALMLLAFVSVSLFYAPRRMFQWKDVEQDSDPLLAARKRKCRFLSGICVNGIICCSIFDIKCEEECLYLRPRFPFSCTMKPVAIRWEQLSCLGDSKRRDLLIPSWHVDLCLKSSGVIITLQKADLRR